MEVTVKNLQKKIPVHPQKIRQTATKTLKLVRSQLNNLSVVFVGPDRMRRINRTYLGHDYVTDVITFLHGEIIICPLIAQQNANTYKTSVDYELTLYLVHGILHLAGYDDHHPKDIARMRAMEARIMGVIAGFI